MNISYLYNKVFSAKTEGPPNHTYQQSTSIRSKITEEKLLILIRLKIEKKTVLLKKMHQNCLKIWQNGYLKWFIPGFSPGF